MQRIRIKKVVPLDDMRLPAPQIQRDALGRIAQQIYDYPSVRVTYTLSWAGTGTVLDSYSQIFTDQP